MTPQDPPPIRACFVCTRSEIYNSPDLPMICTHPNVITGAKFPVRCIEARDKSGPCGPQALHLHVKGE